MWPSQHVCGLTHVHAPQYMLFVVFSGERRRPKLFSHGPPWIWYSIMMWSRAGLGTAGKKGLSRRFGGGGILQTSGVKSSSSNTSKHRD